MGGRWLAILTNRIDRACSGPLHGMPGLLCGPCGGPNEPSEGAAVMRRRRDPRQAIGDYAHGAVSGHASEYFIQHSTLKFCIDGPMGIEQFCPSNSLNDFARGRGCCL